MVDLDEKSQILTRNIRLESGSILYNIQAAAIVDLDEKNQILTSNIKLESGSMLYNIPAGTDSRSRWEKLDFSQ